MRGEVAILIGLAVILFLIPLPYGAVDEWAIFAFEAATTFFFLLYLFLSLQLTPIKKKTRKKASWFQDKSNAEDKLPTKVKKKDGVQESFLERLGEKNQSEQIEANQSKGYGGGGLNVSRLISKLILAFIIIFFFISLLQIIPLPWSVVQLLSPQKFALHLKAQEVLGNEGKKMFETGLASLSLVPALSRYEFWKVLSYLLFSFLLSKICRSRRELKLIILIMLAAGLFQAIYGLAEYLSGTGRIFGYTNIWGRGSAFGTFINRDHYAGFLEMIFPLSLGYLLAGANFFALKRGVSWRQKIVWFSQERLQQTILLAALTTVLGVGLLFSRSRTGVIIFVVIFFLMMLALSMGAKEKGEERGRKEQSKSGLRRRLRLIRIVALAVIFVAAYIGLRPIIDRFTLESLWREARPKFYQLTIRMIADYFLFGTGAGTYLYAYTPYEEEDLHGLLHHAHNDYLETLAEMGLIGGGSIILAAFLALGLLFWRWHQLPERDYFKRGVGLGLIAGILAILIHSLSDFNLRIPANALYFISFYVLAWRLLFSEKEL